MLNAMLNIISLGVLTKLRLNYKPRDGDNQSECYCSAWNLRSQVQCTALPWISLISLEGGFGFL